MESKILRTKKGVVVSDAMDKTVVVLVDRVKTHPLYKKKYTVSKKYKAHDAENQFKKGDVVEIASSKPFSRDKKFIVIKKVK